MVNYKRILADVPKDAWLAFDVNVHSEIIGRYAKLGHKIVCCAGEGEPDESFVDRAYLAGAQIIFSQDADIGLIIDKECYEGIRWQRWMK